MSKSTSDRVRVALPGAYGPDIITRPIARSKAYIHASEMLRFHPVVLLIQNGRIVETINA